MRRQLQNASYVALLVLVPLVLGILIVGGSPTFGRNTRSTTRVGHKALYLVLHELGYDVRRFERGLETLPDEPSVLVALEPGPALFRDRGAYAQGLTRWLERGNAALVTLGPDPDHKAESGDVETPVSGGLERAVVFAEEIRKAARRRRDAAIQEKREQAPAITEQPEAYDPEDSWGPSELFTWLRQPGISVVRAQTSTLSGPILESSLALDAVRPRAFDVHTSSVAAAVSAGKHPVLLEAQVGKGKLFVLSEPRLFHNGNLSRGGHAQLAVQVVDALTAHASSRVVMFEEFSHGGREAETVLDLALLTKARWPVLQLFIVLIVWAFAAGARTRAVQPAEVQPRRSRDEVIDAMASLFLRSGDIAGAAAKLRALTRLRVGENVPLPTTPVETPAQLVETAEALRALRVDLEK